MRTVRELGPLALVTVVALAAATWLLAENVGLGRWVLAAILFAHGWVHVMFVFPRPAPAPAMATAPVGAAHAPGRTTEWPFDLRSSWLVSRGGLDEGAVLALGRLLVVLTFAVSLLAALATAGILVPAGWWAALVVGAALGSLALLVVGWASTLVLGIVIDAWLIWVALAGPWSPLG